MDWIYLWKLLTSQKVIPHGLIILQPDITPHPLDYLDKSQKKMYVSPLVGAVLK